MNDIVITSAARTPIGSFLGSLSTVPAHKLGAVAVAAALERSKLSGDDVDEVLFGRANRRRRTKPGQAGCHGSGYPSFKYRCHG